MLTCDISSVGRVSACHAEGHRFKSDISLQTTCDINSVGRMSAFQAERQEFEPPMSLQIMGKSFIDFLNDASFYESEIG